MIKIIKEGKIPVKTKLIYNFICPNCDCIFACETEDFEFIERRLNGDKMIHCPYCGVELHTIRDKYTLHKEEIKND